jgi:hypothetical protein
MFMLRTTGMGLFLLIAGALGAQQVVEVTVPLDSATRHSGKSYSYPVLVLRSGERIAYARYRIANGLVEVHAPDGGVERCQACARVSLGKGDETT